MTTTTATSVRERLNAVVLLAIVIASLAFIVNISNLDLEAWQEVHADSDQVWEPVGIYGDDWDSAQFNPFAQGHLPLRDIALLVMHYGATLVIGARLLWSIPTTRTWPVGVQMGAGLLVSYLPLAILSRLLSLRFPVEIAAVFILLTEVTIAVIVVLRFNVARSTLLKEEAHQPIARDRASLVGLLFVTVICIVWTYQSGRNFLVSDSLVEFLHVARGDSGPFDYLPLFGKQSDEYLFNFAPLTLGTSASIALWFWLTNALAKVSLLCIAYGATWSLSGKRKFVAAMSCGLLLFVTPAADPRFYLSLVGGQNPSIFLGHAGRFLGIVLPLCLPVFLSRPLTRSTALGAFLLGMGLMSTSIHNLTAATIVIGLVAATTLVNRTGKSVLGPLQQPGVQNRFVALAILAPLFAYASLQSNEHGGYYGIPVALGGGAAFLVAISLSVNNNKEPPDLSDHAAGRLHFGTVAALVVGIGFGVLAMGNIFYRVATGNNPLGRFLGVLAPGFDEPPILVRHFDTELAPFRASDCVNAPTAACRSFEGFLGYFGTTFLVVALLWWALQASCAHQVLRRRDGTLLMTFLLLFQVGLFLTDFLGTTDTVTYWSQTRFFEIGYYGIWLIAPVIVANHLVGFVRRTAFALLICWIIVPVLSHPFLAQWLRNVAHLTRATL